jgi:hypothetical protein
MLKHIVFMKFKPAVTDSEITNLEKAFAGLPGAIPEIKRYEFGRDIIHSERSYDFCLVSAFEDIESMKRYQAHPDHMVVLNMVRGMCDSILAVDFEG